MAISEEPYLARSAARGNGRRQLYAEHVRGVRENALRMLDDLSGYVGTETYARMAVRLRPAATWHDLGKLASENQAVLRDSSSARSLPVPHEDAGARLCFLQGDRCAAALVQGHHAPGLPNMNDEMAKSFPFCRAERRGATDESLDDQVKRLVKRHTRVLPEDSPLSEVPGMSGDAESMASDTSDTLEERMLLSLLVEADWCDAAQASEGGRSASQEVPRPAPRWAERAAKLDAYVQTLEERACDEHDPAVRLRNDLRHDLYVSLKDAGKTGEIGSTGRSISHLVSCDAPVGLGKTTALAAYALARAARLNLRHVFIILPYTSILQQTERMLKEAVVLEDEDPCEVVAVLHHRAEYAEPLLRDIAMGWDAPFVLTTAVQFFETLASNYPARIKKLHQLSGSAIILDEFHASLPPDCLLVAWEWLSALADRWGCEIALSSGTMVRFWDQARFKEAYEDREEYGDGHVLLEPSLLIEDDLRERMGKQERTRVRVVPCPGDSVFPNSEKLVEFVVAQPGPRIVMLDTRRAAAGVAHALYQRNQEVLHLSNSFVPRDCEAILKEIKQRLEAFGEGRVGTNWTLVTTTYAGTGLDLSFRTGFIRGFSCAALLQLKGRIARNSEFQDAKLWLFGLDDADDFPLNPAMQVSAYVLKNLVEQGVGEYSFSDCPPSVLATKAFGDEMMRNFTAEKRQQDLLSLERTYCFDNVARQFKVIQDDRSCLAIVDERLAEKLRSGVRCRPAEVQAVSVALNPSDMEKLDLEEIVAGSGLYFLAPEKYDPHLLGYFKTLIG